MPLKKIALTLIALAVASFVTGCAQVATGINQVTAALSSPNATAAAQNLRIGATAVICDLSSVISDGDTVLSIINSAVAASQIAKGQAATVSPTSALAQSLDYGSIAVTVSQGVCRLLNGSAGSNVAVASISGTAATVTPSK